MNSLMKTRKVVKLFLASPGDLAEERKAARKVVDEFNELWADRSGYQIELVGWEDTISSNRRPQAIINRELEQCELFYGMLWKRWGTPPSINGPYTSGFEEEYRLSQERSKKSGKPEIKISFKEVDPELIRDMGPELSKVVAFKGEIETEKDLFYETFADISEFQYRFRRAITEYVQRLQDLESEASEAAVTETPPQMPSKTDATTELSTAQDSAFLHKYIEKAEAPNSEDKITPFDVARFRLFSLIAGKQGNDEQSLGVHDANLIYRNAKGSSFTLKEQNGLLRSGLENFPYENTPLWHWYREIGGFAKNQLSMYSVFGTTVVRSGALRAMALIRQDISDGPHLGRKSFLDSWFSEESDSNVRSNALRYLAILGTEEDIAYVKRELDRGDYNTRNTAAEAYFKIMARNSRQRALESLNELPADAPSKKTLDEIFSSPATLSAISLLNATKHKNAYVRLLAAKSLRSRKELSKQISEELLLDPSTDVRMEALLNLHFSGHQFSEADAKRILVKKVDHNSLIGMFGSETEGESNYESFRRLMLQSTEETILDKKVEMNSPFNEAEYLVRAEKYYRKLGDQLRRDVRNGFVDFFDAGLKRIADATPPDLMTRLEGVGDIIREGLTRDGLSLIEKRKSKNDLGLVREVLGQNGLKWSDSDAEYLGRFGEWQDIELISRLVEKPDHRLPNATSSDRYRKAARAILKLSKGRLRELLSMPLSDELLEMIIIDSSDRDFRQLGDASITRVLLSRKDRLRKVVAVKTTRALNRHRVKKILADYLKIDEQQYYNVIHWLDLGISAPRVWILAASSTALENLDT